MSVSNLFMAFSQLNFRIFVGCVLILSMFSIQTAFSQENEFTEANGWHRHPNGGGWVHRDAQVSDKVYVGPNAKVHGSQISGGRIDGHAQVWNGVKMSDGEIGGHAVVGRLLPTDYKNITISGGRIDGHATVRGGTIEGGIVTEKANVRSGLIKAGFVGENALVEGGHIEGGRVAGNAHITRGMTVKQGMNLTDGTFSRTRSLRRYLNRPLSKKEVLELLKALRIRIPGISIALALATVASEVVKGETPPSQALPRLSDESVLDAGIINSDTVKWRIDDILAELKTSVQELDPTEAFSEERQMLHNKLRTLYTDVQVDTGLSGEEKEKHLKTIAEIQDIVQPSSPPRNPPRRRNRVRSQPTQGLQGSLDSGDVKQEHTDNLRQEQPTRGIASTGMCLTSDVKTTISHQCLQQCACLLMQSKPATSDTNQKPVNQEVQP